MCQQTFLSKTVKIISIVTLSAVALGSVLTNSSSAMEIDSFPDEDNQPKLKEERVEPQAEIQEKF